MTTPAEGAFSLMVALVGLAGFALALALVEQIVLETNLANVSRGSRVYESNHVSLLMHLRATFKHGMQSVRPLGYHLPQHFCQGPPGTGGRTDGICSTLEQLQSALAEGPAGPERCHHTGC